MPIVALERRGAVAVVTLNRPPAGVAASMFVASQTFDRPEDELWRANDTAIDMIMDSDDLTNGLASFATNGASGPTGS